MSDALSLVIDSKARRVVVLIVLALAAALPTINLTVANAVLPQMQGDLSAGLEEISWVLTAAFVATAIGVPSSGWFSVRFGRRASILFCTAAFTTASAMLGVAATLEEVILWRALQGLFGGPIPSLCMAALLDAFPKRDHAMALATWSGGTMLGPILGPVLGGYLAELCSWRLAFVFLVPFGILTFFLVLSTVSETRRSPGLRMDWVGFATLCCGVAAAQILLDRGNRLDWFDSAEIVMWAAIAVISIYVFTVHCVTTRNPFLDLRVFLDRNYAIGCVCMMVSGALSFAPLFLMPSLLGQLRDVPVETISLMLIPRGVGYAIGTFGLAWLFRIMDGRLMLGLGFAIQAVGFWYMAQFDLSVGPREIFMGGLVLGLGEGIMWTPMATITFLTLSPALRSFGSAIFQFGRFFASGVGVSVAVTLLTRTSRSSHALLGEHINPFNPSIADNVPPLWDPATLGGLARLELELTRQATMIGYVNDFWVLMVVTVTILPLLIFLDRPQRSD
jgi:DHA2 family multidrug resistance protein